MWNKYCTKGLLLAGLILLGACGKEDNADFESIRSGAATRGTLTLQASKSAATKALSLDGTTLSAWWKATETVKVYTEDGTLVGTLAVIPGEGEKPVTATLSGEVDVTGLSAGSELKLVLPQLDLDYTGQDGTLSTLESRYDFAACNILVSSVDPLSGSVFTDSDAEFRNLQSVYRFGFVCGASSTRVQTQSFSVSSASDALLRTRISGSELFGSISVVAPEGGLDYLYTALCNTRAGSGKDDSYLFEVIGIDNALYMGSKHIPVDALNAQGRFIGVSGVPVQKAEMAVSATPAETVW